MSRAFVCDLVPADVRATAVGSDTFALGLAALPASAVAGLLWDTAGPAAPFALSAALMAAAAMLMLFVPAQGAPAACIGLLSADRNEGGHGC